LSVAATEISARPRQNVALGALLMTGAMLCFTLLDAILKHLSGVYSVGMLSWMRNATQTMILLTIVPWLGLRAVTAVKSVPMHLARGACLVGMTVFVTLSLRHMPMTQTYAISFSAPLMAAALASLTLGEKSRPVEWLLISSGFAGVLVALRPDAPDAGWYLMFPVVMAVCNAVYHVLTRHVGRTDGPFAMIFHVAFWALMITTLALPAIFDPMTREHVGLMFLGGAFGTLAQLLLVQAFRRAPTAIVSSMTYTQIFWSAVVAWIAFGEIPTLSTLVGGVVVIVSGLALVRLRSA
jgi:drug/metabolite transporter (DMT)-like permease